MKDCLQKPCLMAGLLLFLGLLSGFLEAKHSRPLGAEEIESSVHIYPEELVPGLQRTIKFIKQADKTPKNCSKKAKNFSIEDFRITPEKNVCYVDTANASKVNKGLSPEFAFEAITKAAAEWPSSVRDLPVLLCYESTTPVTVSFDFDGRNTISWQNLSLFTKDTIGAINLIVDTENKRLVEFDVAWNESLPWAVLEGTGVYSGYYDIQNAMTHAFGYVYGLGEVNKDEACGLVMYPYVMHGETIKRRLGAGDIRGAGKLYKKTN